jgi:hypothetical protein
MPNLVDFRRAYRPRCPSSPDAVKAEAANFDIEPASPNAASTAFTVEEIRRSILMLDLAIQHARLVVARIPDPQARQILIAQIEKIERLLQLARDMTLKL